MSPAIVPFIWFRRKKVFEIPSMVRDETLKVQREKAFHDEWAKTVSLEDLLVREAFESPTAIENRFALESMGDLRGKKVLDLGCGAGETSVYFALQGADVDACDISAGLIGLADRLAEKFGVIVRFKTADSAALPYPDGQFDYVFGNGVLHHVELAATAQEVRRVLKSGGRAIFIEPLPYNPAINVYRAMAKDVRSADERPLSFRKLGDFAAHFGSWKHSEFWLFSLLIFFHFFFVRGWHPSKVRYWKRVVEVGPEYKDSFAKLQAIDEFCLKHLSFLRYLCWNTVLEVRK